MNTAETFGCTSGGQLIRLAIPAARDLGLNPKILGSDPSESVFRLLGDPTGKGIIIPKKNWKDPDTLRNFAGLVGEGNPVTTEWENVPAGTLEILQSHGLVARPNVNVIKKIQDRMSEKELARGAGGTPVPFALIDSFETFRDQVGRLQPPCILKTRGGGYDGKGQWRITEQTNLEDFWKEAFPAEVPPLILEKMIGLSYEASVIVGMDGFGGMELIGPMYNVHENGILRFSIDPAPISDKETQALLSEARKIASGVSNIVDGYVGLLTIEFLIDKNGKIYFNEFAPRPHNSGHAGLDSRDNNQNHLWLGTVTGHVAQKSQVKRSVVMENILSQAELADYYMQRKIVDASGFYDYQKLSSEPNPINKDVRKLGHINHFGDEVEVWVEEFKRGKIDMEELTTRIRDRVL